ncbi:hypothetical protein ACRALDRAFT_1094761 [Sodiomyces alcalophilus JCM 7366]|uniref:uncharacterized protein n=1 Tax=Sodiomyces alcalophilus JCM 7366 TaxID=591952 RepID=UPI0039B6B512
MLVSLDHYTNSLISFPSFASVGFIRITRQFPAESKQVYLSTIRWMVASPLDSFALQRTYCSQIITVCQDRVIDPLPTQQLTLQPLFYCSQKEKVVEGKDKSKDKGKDDISYVNTGLEGNKRENDVKPKYAATTFEKERGDWTETTSGVINKARTGQLETDPHLRGDNRDDRVTCRCLHCQRESWAFSLRKKLRNDTFVFQFSVTNFVAGTLGAGQRWKDLARRHFQKFSSILVSFYRISVDNRRRYCAVPERRQPLTLLLARK